MEIEKIEKYEVQKAKSICVDVTHSVFGNRITAMLYCTKEWMQIDDYYIFSLPYEHFSVEVSEGDQKNLSDLIPFLMERIERLSELEAEKMVQVMKQMVFLIDEID